MCKHALKFSTESFQGHIELDKRACNSEMSKLLTDVLLATQSSDFNGNVIHVYFLPTNLDL